MCCQETKTLNLPPEVIGAFAHYRRLLDERGWEWGDERLPDFFQWAPFSLLGPLFEAVADTGDWAKAVRTVIGDDVRPGIVVVYVDEGRRLHADVGEARAAIPDHTVPVDVVIDSAVAAGERLDIRARVRGPGAETLTLVGPDGIVAEGDAASELRYEAVVDGPTWVAAVAYGGSTPTRSTSRYPPTPRRYTSMLPESAFGASVPARWCLTFLDTLERFVDEHGYFHSETRDAHFGDLVSVLDEARSFYSRVAGTADG